MQKPDLNQIVTALDAKQSGNEWKCRCPAHEEDTPSCYIGQADNGKILFKCFAGCSQSAILSALQDKGLWPKPRAKSARPYGLPPKYDGATFVQCWKYRDYKTQALRGYTVKFIAPDGFSKKIIPYFRKSAKDGWQVGHSQSDNRPLYNGCYAPRAKTIFIVEGEKCADSITSPDKTILGVTWAGGAGAVTKNDWSILANHPDIRIWADNDAPGKKAANWIAAQFAQSKLIDLTQFGEQPEGWDCADWAKGPEAALELILIEPNRRIPLEAPPQDAEVSKPISDAELNDEGNAKRLAKKFNGLIRYVPNVGWYAWDNDFWAKDDSNSMLLRAAEVRQLLIAEALAAENEKTAKRIDAFATSSGMLNRLQSMLSIAAAMPGIVTQPDDLDADPFLFACKNGVINLRDNTICANTPELLITKRSSVAYDPNAIAPTWNRFLKRIMGNNDDLIAFLQRAIGYSLTADTSEQVMFMLWGSGQNGKSVFIETLAKIFGTYHTATTSDLVLLDSQSGENAIARLKGARFVPASEVPENARFHEARIKQLTGQDTIAARYLYKEYFEFRPHFKFWLRCNSRPQIAGGDLGIWRRMHCVPFTETIGEHEKDKHLAQKLEHELSGILNWAIQGCLDWQRIGLAPPEVIYETVQEYKEDMDTIALWLDAACVVDEECRVLSSTLYQSYKSWCEMVGEKPLSQRRLMIKIKDRGFKRVISSGIRYYKGLDVKQTLN